MVHCIAESRRQEQIKRLSDAFSLLLDGSTDKGNIDNVWCKWKWREGLHTKWILWPQQQRVVCTVLGSMKSRQRNAKSSWESAVMVQLEGRVWWKATYPGFSGCGDPALSLWGTHLEPLARTGFSPLSSELKHSFRSYLQVPCISLGTCFSKRSSTLSNEVAFRASRTAIDEPHVSKFGAYTCHLAQCVSFFRGSFNTMHDIF